MVAATAAASKKYKCTTMPIYGSDKNYNPYHIGTCFILDIEGYKYLVTAAHIVDEAKNTTLYIPGAKDLVPIEGEFYCTTPVSCKRDDDHYDYAWLNITGDFFNRLENSNYILETDISNNNLSPEKRVYLAIGFPRSKNKKANPKTKILKPKFARYYSTWKAMPELYAELNLTGDSHISIDYKQQSRDEVGDIVNSFSPVGMSGGLMIDLGRIVTPDELSRSEAYSGLVSGLLIEYHKNHNAILSIKMNEVVNSIKEYANKDTEK